MRWRDDDERDRKPPPPPPPPPEFFSSAGEPPDPRKIALSPNVAYQARMAAALVYLADVIKEK